MKIPLQSGAVLFAAMSALALAGCAPRPIASGEIVLVTLGNKPVPRSNETGEWSAQSFSKGRIAIYETCIIVTEPNGTQHCAPPERFREVRFK